MVMTTLLFGGHTVLETAPVIGPVYNKTPVVKDVISELQILETPKSETDSKTTTDMFFLLGIGMIGYLWVTNR